MGVPASSLPPKGERMPNKWGENMLYEDFVECYRGRPLVAQCTPHRHHCGATSHQGLDVTRFWRTCQNAMFSMLLNMFAMFLVGWTVCFTQWFYKGLHCHFDSHGCDILDQGFSLPMNIVFLLFTQGILGAKCSVYYYVFTIFITMSVTMCSTRS